MPLAAFLILAAAIWGVYGWSLRAPLVFDDAFSITGNPSITRLWPLYSSESGTTPLHPQVELPTSGRPLVNLSFAVNYKLGLLNPFGYHVVNVSLHLLSAMLLWGLLRTTLRLPYFEGRFDRAADLLALLVALAWSLHPLQTEAVEYVTQRTELMVGLFYLSTLYAGLRYSSRPRDVGLPGGYWPRSVAQWGCSARRSW